MRAPGSLLKLASSGTFDPNLDANCNGGIVQQTGGPSICVVRYQTIVIDANAGLTISGTPQGALTGRSIAFVADDDLTINGGLDAGARGTTSGPGGGVLRSGGLADFMAMFGGGGAGFKTAGGHGGSSSSDGGAANGGAAGADPALLAALIGGPANGGGAGGAATLISCRGTVSVTGSLSAGGGGGFGGFEFLGHAIPGGGGGAGGYVVLQGAGVSVTGQMFANGGGGGAGNALSATQGEDGADGSFALVSAGGGLSHGSEGHGGDGGFIGAAPTAGGRSTGTSSSPGGGGGSMGFFQTYTPAGVTPTLTPSLASPGFQPNGTITTR